MQISNFDHVRLGSQFPAVFDVSPIYSHECYGVYAVAYQGENTGKLELRRKGNHVALFNFFDKATPLPEYWTDSELLWSSENNQKNYVKEEVV